MSKDTDQTLELLIEKTIAARKDVERLQDAIRKHRDFQGDNRCWMDDEELYKVLPEGYTPPEREVEIELKNCETYLTCRRNPATEYTSPQRRIEELEQSLALQNELAASQQARIEELEAEIADFNSKRHKLEE